MKNLSLLAALLLPALTLGQDCVHPFIPVGGVCIYIDPFVKGTMQAMRDQCKAYSGDLIWFDDLDLETDCELYSALLSHIHENNLNEKDYWVGISELGHLGQWKYLRTNKEARMGAPYWVANNPTNTEGENCAIFHKNNGYYWIDSKCDLSYYAICRHV